MLSMILISKLASVEAIQMRRTGPRPGFTVSTATDHAQMSALSCISVENILGISVPPSHVYKASAVATSTIKSRIIEVGWMTNWLMMRRFFNRISLHCELL